ncbi:carboxymuconolactone decarboxylase family protein [Mesorhizobium sp. YC-39]|uniref:carboxymuconolactone decarboxylase family protein n=1 Tax=unclassified Mesorhizobium TaxID=325217 RepID=UPI0021E90FC8|nr:MULTISPECIES: carboxymuconolactone decarboxylase family protein [unclassified Mesorhizobium]MCV3210629.1 carboxymuconolactone decarboxylase family protein [Mesorhizobium sp. YC-2]MCV3232473.1 carboxymuconolactone decarboxylase family protein [Mesorhizobium sp. YC-39]
MKKTLTTAALIAATVLFAASSAAAQQLPTAEETYKEIEATIGTVPTHLKAYPKSAIAGAWAMTKGLDFGDEGNALEPKVKSLINLAVAAQIPCRYCIWLETKMAKDRGATNEEVAEAVALAGYVRHWSTVLNGMQIDFETFKTEFGGD